MGIICMQLIGLHAWEARGWLGVDKESVEERRDRQTK